MYIYIYIPRHDTPRRFNNDDDNHSNNNNNINNNNNNNNHNDNKHNTNNTINNHDNKRNDNHSCCYYRHRISGGGRGRGAGPARPSQQARSRLFRCRLLVSEPRRNPSNTPPKRRRHPSWTPPTNLSTAPLTVRCMRASKLCMRGLCPHVFVRFVPLGMYVRRAWRYHRERYNREGYHRECSVYIYIYIYICTHIVCIHIHMCVYIYIYIYTHTYMYTRILCT